MLAFSLFLTFLLAACRTTPTPQPVSPLPTPTPLAALQAPGDFTLDGLLKMKVRGEGITAIIALDAPAVPLANGTLVYATVNRLTGEWVELDRKIHVAWWDASEQKWRAGWVDRDALIYR